MFPKGFIKRGQAAMDRRAERQEKQSDPAYQGVMAERLKHRLAEEERARVAAEAARLELEGPARAIALLMIERLGSDLPEIVSALAKPGGMAKVMRILEQEAARQLHQRADAAKGAEAASMVELHADMSRRARARREAAAESKKARRTAKAGAAA